MIKAIIFDFDGVIHDTISITHDIFKIFKPNISLNDYKKLFNANIFNKIKLNKREIAKYYNHQYEMFESLKIERKIKKELLNLKKEYSLYIISSNNELILKRYFENNNLSTLFDDIMGYETHISKIEKFKILIKRHNLKISDCIFVTDTLGDIREANKVGIKTIAVDYGVHDESILKKGKPFKIISNIKEIKLLIK